LGSCHVNAEKYINRNDRETHFDFEMKIDEEYINVEEKEYVL
jgi:hypothetical protein